VLVPVSILTSSASEGFGVVEVPTHLADWAVPEVIPTDGFTFQVRLRCPCGGERLRLLHPGGMHWHPNKVEAFAVCVTVGGRPFFLVRAECARCGRSKLIFDADLHGRTSIVEHDPARAADPRPPLLPWACVRCGCGEHAAFARYVLHCPEDFDLGVRAKCPDARREDAFVWFGMDTTCHQCGLFTWLWAEHETL
jgi:hypothetical protein